MKIVQIGAAGHYAYALPTAKKYGLAFEGLCAADPEDDLDRAQRELSAYGFAPRIYRDWREMLLATAPDIAVVNTVMARKSEIAAFALAHGISVFCEKPVATDMAALVKLEDAYRNSVLHYKNKKNICFCGMFGIDYLPHFETAYRFVKSGALGDIRLANAQKSYKMGRREKFYSDREKYGGTIPWVAIHAIEWIQRIGGLSPVSVTAYGSTACNAGNGTMEASTLCLFDCEGGRMASVSADVMRPSSAPTHDDDRLRLVGSGGILEVRGGHVYVIDGKGERELSPVHTEKELFEEFMLEILGDGKCRVSAEDAFSATRTALAARESQDTGKTVRIGEVGQRSPDEKG